MVMRTKILLMKKRQSWLPRLPLLMGQHNQQQSWSKLLLLKELKWKWVAKHVSGVEVEPTCGKATKTVQPIKTNYKFLKQL